MFLCKKTAARVPGKFNQKCHCIALSWLFELFSVILVSAVGDRFSFRCGFCRGWVPDLFCRLCVASLSCKNDSLEAFFVSGDHIPVIFNCRSVRVYIPHRVKSVGHGTLLLSGTVRLFSMSGIIAVEWRLVGWKVSFSFWLYHSRSQSVCQALFNLFGNFFSKSPMSKADDTQEEMQQNRLAMIRFSWKGVRGKPFFELQRMVSPG